jgi:hypothetical protein
MSYHSSPRICHPFEGPHTLVSTAPNSLYNIRISQRISLDTLHVYESGTYIEYPESSKEGWIGHLFSLDPVIWYNPSMNFVYSMGEPKGKSKKGKPVFCGVLVDENGNQVPCQVAHSTCMYASNKKIISQLLMVMRPGQGVKICSLADIPAVSEGHCSASRQSLKLQLEKGHQHDSRQMLDSFTHDLYKKTFAFWMALCKQGCGAPGHEQTYFSAEETSHQLEWADQKVQGQRGDDAKVTCDGRLVFERDSKGKPLVW